MARADAITTPALLLPSDRPIKKPSTSASTQTAAVRENGYGSRAGTESSSASAMPRPETSATSMGFVSAFFIKYSPE
eukprot:5711882-Pleurochrysis_carterae.AAC.1